MDTKWKKSKRWIGFTAFFLGLTLFLGNLLHIIAMIAGGITTEDMKDAFQPDYQNTSAFQFYMEGYLEDFLSMASGGKVDFSWNNDSRTRGISYSSYYGVESFGYGGDGNIAVVGIQGDQGKTSASYVTVTSSEGASDSVAAEASDEQSAGNDVVAENTSDWSVQNSEGSESTDSAEAESSNAAYAGTSSQDQKEENRRAADEAHEMLKDCKNLLYTITYDDKELYSNTGDLQLNGEEHLLPEGYNFLLYFDGSKVYIQKDGRELDIYGNGIYTDNGSWFVPGYENFAVDDKYKDARITIAAAEDPKQYTVAVYGQGYTYYTGGNRLYQIVKTMQDTRNSLTWILRSFIAAVLFLSIAFIFRKDIRDVRNGLARFTGRLWYEVKILAVLVPVGVLVYYLVPIVNSKVSGILDTTLIVTYDMAASEAQNLNYGNLFHDIYYQLSLMELRPLILCVFWLIWLVVNDARLNSKVWKNSLFVKIRRNLSSKEMEYPFQKRLVRRFRKLPVISVIMTALLLTVMFLWGKGVSFGAFNGVILWSAAALAILAAAAAQTVYIRSLRRDARDMGDLVDQIYAVREGDMEAPLNLPADSDLHDAVTCMNEVREGMKEAIDEQVRSERMKVELIANVSHDIKTPLTSIISYVELLKEEEELPDHVKDYISILESKSQRLKTMVQDVFEVSKAASGELPVNPETIDFAKLLRQTLADMEEDIKNSNVIVRTRIPEGEHFIRADGQRMYRVFQNLIQNALQYSLEGSRVYVSLEEKNGLLTASVTNTSAEELSETIDYTARFTRGDSSRTDGGSGLGLSIARSFTEACQGNFYIEIKADLFTACVEFKETDEEEKEIL